MRERLTRLMLRAGIANQAQLVAECQKIKRRPVGVEKRHYDSVGRNLVNNLFNGKARAITFEQIDILCMALKCSPNELLGYEELAGLPVVARPAELRELSDKVDRVVRVEELLLKLAEGESPLAEQIRSILRN